MYYVNDVIMYKRQHDVVNDEVTFSSNNNNVLVQIRKDTKCSAQQTSTCEHVKCYELFLFRKRYLRSVVIFYQRFLPKLKNDLLLSLVTHILRGLYTESNFGYILWFILKAKYFC